MLPRPERPFNTREAVGPVDPQALSAAITARLEADGARPHAGELLFRCPAPDHEDRNPSAGWKPDGGQGAGGVWCCYSRHCEAAHGGGGALALAALLRMDVDAFRTASGPAAPRAAASTGRSGADANKGQGQGQRTPAAAVAAPTAAYAGLADFERRRGLPAGYLAAAWNVTEGMHKGRPVLFWPTAPGMPRRWKAIDERKGYGWEFGAKAAAARGLRGGGPFLYGLPAALAVLAADPSAPLYLVNGEPSLWAAAFAGIAAVCLAVGEGSAGAGAKLAPDLAAALEAIGRPVALRVAYDADGAGRAGGPKLAAALAAAGMNAAALDLAAWQGWQTHAMPDGADVGDMFQAASADGLAAALANLPTLPGEPPAPDKVQEAKEPPESQAAALVRIGRGAELFCDEDGRAFAYVARNGQRETHAVKSGSFRRWLVFTYSREHGGRVPASSTIADALNVLEGHAAYDDGAKVLPVHVRYAEHDGRIFVDLGGPDWRAVEVSADGWHVIDAPPVRFRRAKAMTPLPEPERGGSLDLLRDFVNLEADDWPLFLGWLVCAMRPTGPYPVLVLGGEQGSSKSTIMRVARRLVDPNTASLRAEPKEARDLMISANNGWCLALDNLDRVEPWLSNALCRLATGGGFSVRTNYADDEETIFQATRPITLNGIGDVATRPDLLERSLMLAPPSIPDHKRKTEAAFWRDFGQVEGQVFGALLDALSTAIRRLPNTHLERLPRMADAALWVTAAEPAMGIPAGAYVAAMSKNRGKAASLALEASPVAAALLSYLDEFGSHEGTTGALLLTLAARVDRSDRPTGWPKSTVQLSTLLRRILPALRERGVTRDLVKDTSAGKVYRIAKGDATRLVGGTLARVAQVAQAAPVKTPDPAGNRASVPVVPLFPPQVLLDSAAPALLPGEV